MYISTILLFASTALTAVAAPSQSDIASVATALSVTPADIENLERVDSLANFDLALWTHWFPEANTTNYSTWDDEIKLQFLKSTKQGIKAALTPEQAGKISKRIPGTQSPAARAQVAQAVNNARASRDASHGRKLLQCNSGTQGQCTRCAGACSLGWASAVSICSGVALTEEVLSSGLLTLGASLQLAGCIGVATAAYSVCIDKCLG